MNGCDYKGSDIQILTGINSLMRCGKACFNTKGCNYFTLASSICSLKNVSDMNQVTVAQSSICGMVQNRVPKSAFVCDWQTSEDGSYKWTQNCCISPKEPTTHKEIGLIPDPFHGGDADQIIRSIHACAKACKANPDCDFFNYLYSRHCTLNKYYNGFLTKEYFFGGNNFGFMVTRKSNIEFIPNYCLNYSPVN